MLLAKCYNRMTNSLAKFALCFAVRDGCNQHCLNNDTVALKHLRRSITTRASYRRVGTIVPENRNDYIYKSLEGPLVFLSSVKPHPRTRELRTTRQSLRRSTTLIAHLVSLVFLRLGHSPETPIKHSTKPNQTKQLYIHEQHSS